ncbi:hypothetical protein Tco_0487659 [Tanacetum coccineum]
MDVGVNTDLNLLLCALCDNQPDSHGHFFFECPFSLKVWSYVHDLARMDLARMDMEAQARVVLFFPTPWFFPLGFPREGFLRRQSFLDLAPPYTWMVGVASCSSSTEHPTVNDFVIINIPEEDVEPKQIILDPDDQPMWESAKTVASNPNSAIIQLDVDDNFVINGTHLKMIWENKFDGYLRADPHDHIREFLAICDMFKYGKTQSEAVKLLVFPFS